MRPSGLAINAPATPEITPLAINAGKTPAPDHQRQMGKGTNRHERRMPQTDLTGVPGNQHQTKSGQRPNHHRGQLTNVITTDQPGRNQRYQLVRHT
jgi:hypothetical protein